MLTDSSDCNKSNENQRLILHCVFVNDNGGDDDGGILNQSFKLFKYSTILAGRHLLLWWCEHMALCRVNHVPAS